MNQINYKYNNFLQRSRCPHCLGTPTESNFEFESSGSIGVDDLKKRDQVFIYDNYDDEHGIGINKPLQYNSSMIYKSTNICLHNSKRKRFKIKNVFRCKCNKSSWITK